MIERVIISKILMMPERVSDFDTTRDEKRVGDFDTIRDEKRVSMI